MTRPNLLGSIKQTAFVTHDIEATAQEWVDIHGIGPWFIYTVDIPDTKYGEQFIPLKARMALAQSGSQQIELIEPSENPSIYTEFIDAGKEGMHHICYWANIDDARTHFNSIGYEEAQYGVTSNGNEFLYVYGSQDIPFIEIVDPNESMSAFFALVAQSAQDWNGSDPLRFL